MGNFHWVGLRKIKECFTKFFSHVSIIIHIEMLKLILPWISPTKRNLKSKAICDVKLFPECNLSKWFFTREAPYRSFWIKKQQSLKLKVLRFVFTIAGKICYRLELSLEQPYIKQFFLREWPWKSQYKTKSRSYFILLIICLAL